MATILILDDRILARNVLKSLLDYHGHRVLEADSGERALSVVRAEKPDLVLTDVLMPRLGGYQFVLRLREESRLVRPRVIFRAASYVEAEARALARACGVRHLVTDQTDPETLLATIDTVLSAPLPQIVGTIAPDSIGKCLSALAEKFYWRVTELEMLNLNLEQKTVEGAVRLDTARAALEHEVAKRLWAEKELTQANAALRAQVVRDPLTGLYNRRYLEESLDREESRAKRSGQPLGLMMIDIDHFKRCNDTYGHAAGDEVLRAVARYMESQARAEDILCRYGGEEFVAVMVNTAPATLWERADELRQGIRDLKIEHDDRQIGSMTLSIGLATFPFDGGGIREILRVADAALYRAKAAGRNCICVAGKVGA